MINFNKNEKWKVQTPIISMKGKKKDRQKQKARKDELRQITSLFDIEM